MTFLGFPILSCIAQNVRIEQFSQFSMFFIVLTPILLEVPIYIWLILSIINILCYSREFLCRWRTPGYSGGLERGYDAARRALLSTVRRSSGIGIPVCFFTRKQNALLYKNAVMSHGEQYK